MTLALGTIVETVTRGLWLNQYPCYNIQRWKVTQGAPITDAQAAADFKTRMDQVMNVQDDIQCNTIYYQSHVFNEVYPNPRFISFITNNKTRGSLPENPLPIGAVLRFRQLTEVSKRQSNKFFSGASVGQATNGAVTLAALASLDSVAFYLSNGIGISGRQYLPVVWSPTYLASSLVISYVLDPFVCYFTRRRPKL